MTGFDVLIVNNDSELILKGLNYWSEKKYICKATFGSDEIITGISFFFFLTKHQQNCRIINDESYVKVPQQRLRL